MQIIRFVSPLAAVIVVVALSVVTGPGLMDPAVVLGVWWRVWRIRGTGTHGICGSGETVQDGHGGEVVGFQVGQQVAAERFLGQLAGHE